MKKFVAMVLVFVLIFALSSTAFAVYDDTGIFYFKLTRTAKVDTASACQKTVADRYFYVTVRKQTPRGTSSLVGGDMPVFRSFFGTDVPSKVAASNPAYPPKYGVEASASYYAGEGGQYGVYWIGGAVSNQSAHTSFQCTGEWRP